MRFYASRAELVKLRAAALGLALMSSATIAASVPALADATTAQQILKGMSDFLKNQSSLAVDSGCLVAPGCRLRDQPLDRCPSHPRRAERGGSLTGAFRGLRASQRSRFAIRRSRLPEAARRA
jgi:hypothetical protein